jgi:hypothetical protein
VRFALAAALVLATGLWAAGCSSSPTGPDGGGSPQYPRRTSPENTLAKLVMAYEAMDADGYLDCLSEDFVFFVNPYDTLDYQPLPPFWYRAVEDTIARRMFRASSGIDSITVDLTQDGDPEEIPAEGPGDPSSWRYTERARVRVHLPQDITLHADGRQVFLVRPDEDDAGVGGEVLWEISEWREFEYARAPGRHDPSWSRIKAYFGGLLDDRDAGRGN